MGLSSQGRPSTRLDEAPGHLVLEEVDVLGRRHLEHHAVTDDVERGIDEHHVALGAERRIFSVMVTGRLSSFQTGARVTPWSMLRKIARPAPSLS